MNIFLYPYNGSNPLKNYRSVKYNVLIQDTEGNRHEVTSYNSSDRFRFNREGTKKIHAALEKGGTVKFVIYPEGDRVSKYWFSVSTTKEYKKAYGEWLHGDFQTEEERLNYQNQY